MVRASRRKYHILYKTTCHVTGRYYIGIHSTDDIDDGYLGSGIHLTRSVKKYGRLAHTREVLEILPSRADLKAREAEVVTEDLIKSDVLCMNLIKGGNSNDRAFGITEKTRELLSIASKRFIRTKEHYEKVVATRRANNSYQHSEETRQRLSEVNKGKTLTEEHKAAISVGNQGRVVTAETRAKIGNANRGKLVGRKRAPFSEETREKLRQAQLGRKYSPESRALMSAKAKARCLA